MRNLNLYLLIFATITFCSSHENHSSSAKSESIANEKAIPERTDTINKVELKAEYFDLKTLPPSKSISFYEFQDKNNIGVGVLKQGYTFNLVSWIRAEDFGISCVFITSKSPEKILPARAKAYLDRMDFVYTPKHGSWLNMAEIQFALVGRDALDKPFKSKKEVEGAVKTWEIAQNQLRKGANWQFTTEKARIKLKKLYPTT